MISDYDMTERMLKEFIKKVTTFSCSSPAAHLCALWHHRGRGARCGGRLGSRRRPPGLSDRGARGRRHRRLRSTSPSRTDMVVDIGGGTADIAVIPGRRGGVRLHQDRA